MSRSPAGLTRRSFLAAGAAALAIPAALRSVAYAGEAPAPDVIVLGAGLSGLGTAALLEEAGLRVVVLEGRTRVGGRLYTRSELPGHPEFGGNSAAPGYGRWIAAAKACGLPLVDVMPRALMNAEQVLVLDGRIVSAEQWARSPRNAQPPAQRTLMPWAYAGRAFGPLNPLASYADWLAPANASLDVSLREFLLAHGVDAAAIDLSFDTMPGFGDTSHDLSLLMHAFAEAWGRAQMAGVQKPAAYAIAGGNQQLPAAMARRLRGPVRLGARVVGIETAPEAASVTLDSGERLRARAVVSSLPYSTLRQVRIAPLLAGVQHEAVHELPYNHLALMAIVPRRPFWRDDGLPPSMWTDGPAGGLIAQRFGATDDEVTGFLAYGRGRTGLHWDRIGPQAASELVVREIERARPAAHGALEVAAVHSWTMDPWSAGSWAVFRPGQVQRFLPAMAAPHQRLYFCGEHTATGNRGMEAALESAERVAIEVLTDIA